MKKKSIRELSCIIALLSIVLCIFFYDVIFLGKTFKITTGSPQALSSGPYGQSHNTPRFLTNVSAEVPNMQEPLYEFIARSLRQGILPLWNPHQACGFPLIGMMQIGMFFPLNMILYVFPSLVAWDLLLLSRFLAASLFTYLFMRTLRLGALPSFAAAISFMLSGPMVLQHDWFANVDILIPLVLLTLERLIRAPGRRSAGWAGLAVALTFVAGHPEHVFFINLFGGLYVCFRMLSARPRPALRNIVPALLGAYVLALALSAFVLFPFLQNFATEFWHNHPPNVGARTDGNPWHILTILVPYFFQEVPLSVDYDREIWFGGYIGLIPVGLAFLALLGKQRRGLNYFMAALTLLNVLKVYIDSPLVQWIGYLPLINKCRFFVHTTHLLAFTVAVLVGFALRLLLSRRKLFFPGLAFGTLTGGALIFYLNHFRGAEYFAVSLRASRLAALFLAVFLVFLFLRDRGWLKRKYCGFVFLFLLGTELFLHCPHERVKRLDSFPKVPYMEVLKKSPLRTRSFGVFWAFYPNTASAYGVDDFGINLGPLPERYVQFFNHFIFADYFRQDLQHSSVAALPVTFFADSRPYLDLLNVGFSVAHSRLKTLFPPAARPGFPQPFYDEEVKIYAHASALPRAFIVHRADFEPDEERMFEKIRENKNHLRQRVILHEEPAGHIIDQLQTTPLSDDSSARLLSYSPNEVVVQADMKNAGFLVLADSYHPDWQAFVNGKREKIFIADYLLRAVFLPVGKQEIRFLFRPKSFYAGAALSLLSFFLWVAMMCGGRSLRRPDSNTGRPRGHKP